MQAGKPNKLAPALARRFKSSFHSPNPILMKFETFEHGRAFVNGVRLHQRIGGQSGAPLVVLVHGWLVHARTPGGT